MVELSRIKMNGRDFSIRIPANPKRIKILEEKAVEKKALPAIRDVMFKPKGVSLDGFHPGEICVRLREFSGGERQTSLVEIKTIKTETGYTDEKKKLGEDETAGLIAEANKLGYEQWGEMTTVSTEYRLKFDEGSTASVLSQKITPVGTYLKIESPTQEGLQKALGLLSATSDEKISKNAAVLLGERLGLILS